MRAATHTHTQQQWKLRACRIHMNDKKVLFVQSIIANCNVHCGVNSKTMDADSWPWIIQVEQESHRPVVDIIRPQPSLTTMEQLLLLQPLLPGQHTEQEQSAQAEVTWLFCPQVEVRLLVLKIKIQPSPKPWTLFSIILFLSQTKLTNTSQSERLQVHFISPMSTMNLLKWSF